MSDNLDRLLQIMRRLRDPILGCEWDLRQDFKSIAPYTIEEAYEVADAIERKSMHDLRDELGDLLLQVVFHAQMADEQNVFSFDDVAAAIAHKMESRHPHVFKNAAGTMTKDRWEDLKERERTEKGAESSMDGIAKALPALMRAQKLQARAARDGFDWPSIDEAAEKLHEELAELDAAETSDERLDEAGDLLFCVVNLIRKHALDAETALRHANEKFERRYRAMEERAKPNAFGSLSPAEQDTLWQAVKLNGDAL